ncbi:hypothetical protein ACJIZ3_016960 [Penstemon smallii]|uniref:Secreted protein n=1 Tax=Penstemon smallii TaxID=265156 RepID=A0ABD3SUK3_9LAMI
MRLYCIIGLARSSWGLAKLLAVHYSLHAMWQKSDLLPEAKIHYRQARNDFFAPVFFFFPSSSSILLHD